jgi:hypothetical protein
LRRIGSVVDLQVERAECRCGVDHSHLVC